MEASPSAARARPWARSFQDPLGGALSSAHWLAGAAFVLLGVIWLQTSIGGSWSSASGQNLYLANVLLLYMMVAIGLNLISGYVGAASIGHIGLFSIGAYTEAILTTSYGWHVWPAILAGALVATAASIPVGLILLRLSGWYFSVVTLLLVVVVSDLVLQQRDLTGGGAGLFGLTMPFLGSRQLDLHDYVYLVGAANLVIFLMIRYLVDRSRWGRAFVAVRQVEPAARAAGIHPFMVQESTLAMSGFLAGLAGGLFAPLPGLINPDSFPILDSIFFLLAILAGGMGTVAGPVVGTLALYLMPQWINRQPSLRDWSFLIYGGLLLLFVVFLPEGIVGGVRRLWYRAFGGRMRNKARELALEWPGAAEAESEALGYLDRIATDRQSAPAIEARGIVKVFSGVAAVDGVDLEVKRGTIHAVIGPNGSGKTSLLNVISGFYRQERGSVSACGRAIRPGRASASIRHGIARTFQTPQMIPELTALENVALGSHTRGRVSILEALLPLPHVWREWHRLNRRAMACIALVGLGPEAAAAPCGALPFAHRRLLEIARALAGEPEIVLLDEPASGLHPDEVRQFVELLSMLRAHGLTVVLVEHNFDLVGQVADTITVLDAGKRLAEGDLKAVSSNPAVVEAYLGA